MTIKPNARTIADAREIYKALVACGYTPETARFLARKEAEDHFFARQDINDSAGLAAHVLSGYNIIRPGHPARAVIRETTYEIPVYA